MNLNSKNELDYQIKPLKLVFFFNKFSGVLYFVFSDALITELVKIFLLMGKNSGEGKLSEVFFDVSRVRWGVSLT